MVTAHTSSVSPGTLKKGKAEDERLYTWAPLSAGPGDDFSDLCGSSVRGEVWLNRECSRRPAVPLCSSPLKCDGETSLKITTFDLQGAGRVAFKSPALASSPWSRPRVGSLLTQCLPSFWRAGATSQSLMGTSTMRSHSSGNGRHRSPSSRSMTCVML